MVSESLVYEFCASGELESSIETVKRALAERARTLAEALRRDSPRPSSSRPQGGYFMWVTLPGGHRRPRALHAAAERGVAFVKGTDFLLEGGENTLRLAYSGVTTEQIETGVARLAEAYRSPQRSSSGRSAGRARAAPAARCAPGGEGSAITETVSATLGVTAQIAAVGGLEHDLRVVALGERAPPCRARARGLEVVQQVLGLVLEAQHAHARADLDVGERHAAEPRPGDDRVPVRAGLGVADRGEHAFLEHRRHRVLEPLRLLVHLVPGHAEHVGEEALDQAVAADDALRRARRRSR